LRDLVRLFDLQDSLRDLNPNAVRNRNRPPDEKAELTRQLAEAERQVTELGERLVAVGLVRPSDAKTKAYVTTDIGPKAAQNILEFFAGDKGQAILNRLAGLGIDPQGSDPRAAEASAAPLAGLTFVLTGTLLTMDRNEAKERIAALGGKAAGSVSSNTTYLVAGANTGATKTRKAEQLGVEIIDEERLLAMLAGEGLPSSSQAQELAQPEAPEPTPSPTTQTDGDGNSQSGYGELFDWGESRKPR
jgi:NAD-dependent DNA ligase